MRLILAFFLSTAILLQVVSKSIIAFEFAVNQKYISSTLCVNKDKPMMHCNGHCHLKKQLDQQEKGEQSTPAGSTKEANEMVYFFEMSDATIFSFEKSFEHCFYFPQSMPVDFAASVFHPPSVS